MKVIIFNTPKGIYQIPLQLIAENRADYYSEADGFEKNSPEWNEEVEWVMDDNFEGIDWLMNNSDFEDWEKDAIKVNEKIKITEEEFWTDSGDFEIIEV